MTFNKIASITVASLICLSWSASSASASSYQLDLSKTKLLKKVIKHTKWSESRKIYVCLDSKNNLYRRLKATLKREDINGKKVIVKRKISSKCNVAIYSNPDSKIEQRPSLLTINNSKKENKKAIVQLIETEHIAKLKIDKELVQKSRLKMSPGLLRLK